MRIAYAYDEPLPHTGADAEQVVNTVAALGRNGVSVQLADSQRLERRAPTRGTAGVFPA
jgi:hypothetical protein